MISSLAYGKEKKNTDELLSYIRDASAYAGNDEWRYLVYNSIAEMRLDMDDNPLLNLICYDFSTGDELNYLQEIRKKYKEASLLLVADSKVSPMEYLKPGIMASSLLLKPWNTGEAKSRIKEFISAFYEDFMQDDNSNSFAVETRDGRTTIPYSNIYYFEARQKKVYVCAGGEEIGFYDTIDALEEQLPDNFVRCHRSFIVNKLKIKSVYLSQNLIELYDYFEVPLSRSYKPLFKNI